MSGTSFYDSYVPNVLRILDALDAVLTKAETYAKEKGIDANAEYIDARLIEDMKPLTFQVYTVSRLAKAGINGLTGVAPEDWEGEESLKTFDDLHARVEKTRALFKAATPEQINGKENDDVEVKLGPSAFQVKANVMVFQLYQPNLFFHLVTAYGILRAKGVPLGKFDFLGPFAGDVFPRPK